MLATINLDTNLWNPHLLTVLCCFLEYVSICHNYDVICIHMPKLNKSLLTPRQPLKGSISISGQVAVVSFKLCISFSVSILGAERHHVERWRGTQWEYFKLPPSNYRNRGLEYLNPKFMLPDPHMTTEVSIKPWVLFQGKMDSILDSNFRFV